MNEHCVCDGGFPHGGAERADEYKAQGILPQLATLTGSGRSATGYIRVAHGIQTSKGTNRLLAKNSRTSLLHNEATGNVFESPTSVPSPSIAIHYLSNWQCAFLVEFYSETYQLIITPSAMGRRKSALSRSAEVHPAKIESVTDQKISLMQSVPTSPNLKALLFSCSF